MHSNISKKIIHILIIVVIIFIILSIAGILILRYEVEGESNVPFRITKISIIESVEGIQKDTTTEKWNFDVNENNDIYIYIEKNEGYNKTEIIDEVKVDNINIEKTNNVGETKIYDSVTEENRMFMNTVENEATEIKYIGDLKSNMKEQKISNQGGKIAFRYAINNISQYISNEGEEINHSQLLQLTGVKAEDIETKLKFNLTIKLRSGKIYQAQIELNIPTEEIIKNGTYGIEIKELENIIFKRIEN